MLRRLALFVVGAAALGIALLTLLVYGFGLRVLRDGSGWPMLAFGGANAHYDALEAHRAAQRADAPAPAAPSPPAAPAAAEPAAMPASAPSAEVAQPVAAAAGRAAAAAEAGASPGAPTPADASLRPPAEPGPALKAAGYWIGFRGPLGDGIYAEMPLSTAWPAGGPRRLWTQPVGAGHSSFVAANGVAFTIEQRRRREVVAAYAIDTGRELWTNEWDALFQESAGGPGPRATPAWHAGRLYALGATGELRCLDAGTGRLVWRTNILEDNGAENARWAMAASPLVVDGKVIVLPGGAGGRSVVAYDAATGERVWSALDDQQAYTAPMVATLAGQRQIVIVSARRAAGLSIDRGTLLWEYPWVTDFDVNAAQPVVVGDSRLFLSAGYGHGAAVFELTPRGETMEARTIWQNNRMKNKLSSSVFFQGHVYGLDEGILACVDAATGELKWKGGRYGHGQLLLAGDHLIITTERGELALVKATPESHQEAALVPGIDGRTWNHPAIEGGRLLVRNGEQMAAFDLR